MGKGCCFQQELSHSIVTTGSNTGEIWNFCPKCFKILAFFHLLLPTHQLLSEIKTNNNKKAHSPVTIQLWLFISDFKCLPFLIFCRLSVCLFLTIKISTYACMIIRDSAFGRSNPFKFQFSMECFTFFFDIETSAYCFMYRVSASHYLNIIHTCLSILNPRIDLTGIYHYGRILVCYFTACLRCHLMYWERKTSNRMDFQFQCVSMTLLKNFRTKNLQQYFTSL